MAWCVPPYTAPCQDALLDPLSPTLSPSVGFQGLLCIACRGKTDVLTISCMQYRGPGTLRPMASRRRCRRRLSVEKGSGGLATRQVSSRNTRPPPRGIAYRKEGGSRSVPHSPSPPAGWRPGSSLRQEGQIQATCRQAIDLHGRVSDINPAVGRQPYQSLGYNQPH